MNWTRYQNSGFGWSTFATPPPRFPNRRQNLLEPVARPGPILAKEELISPKSSIAFLMFPIPWRSPIWSGWHVSDMRSMFAWSACTLETTWLTIHAGAAELQSDLDGL